MTTLALIASPGKIRALKIGLVRHLNICTNTRTLLDVPIKWIYKVYFCTAPNRRWDIRQPLCPRAENSYFLNRRGQY